MHLIKNKKLYHSICFSHIWVNKQNDLKFMKNGKKFSNKLCRDNRW